MDAPTVDAYRDLTETVSTWPEGAQVLGGIAVALGILVLRAPMPRLIHAAARRPVVGRAVLPPRA